MRIIMSKYIPGNQKHLTLNDRIYIENELAKGTSFKDIAAFLCKDPTTISKEVRAHRISDWYHKGTFYNSKNFCIHRYHCKKTNACEKFFSVALSVPHVQPVIRPAKILKKNDVNAWTKHRTFVMDAPKRLITAQSHINTIITDVLPTESIVNY